MKKHMFWIVELFVWLLILFLVSGGILLAKYNFKKSFNTYQIFLPDVDGLISGSPVRLMGIQIGYVNQIDIVGEDVYVKFIITDSHVRVPEGSTATVEFTGLGGSKSLELSPPESENNPTGKFLIAQSPKRISDSLGLLNDMFDQVIELTYTVSRFMDKVGLIKGEKINCEEFTAEQMLNYSNDWIEKAQKQCDKLDKKINGEKDGRKSNKSD